MVGTTHPGFTVFSTDSLLFFQSLAANNSKQWFQAHRDEYEEHLLEPLKLLVGEMAGCMVVPETAAELEFIFDFAQFDESSGEKLSLGIGMEDIHLSMAGSIGMEDTKRSGWVG